MTSPAMPAERNFEKEVTTRVISLWIAPAPLRARHFGCAHGCPVPFYMGIAFLAFILAFLAFPTVMGIALQIALKLTALP